METHKTLRLPGFAAGAVSAPAAIIEIPNKYGSAGSPHGVCMGRNASGRRRERRSRSWISLAALAIFFGAAWGALQVFLLPALPYFYIVWWIISAGVQFLIGRFLAYRVRFRRTSPPAVAPETVAGGMALMGLSYAVSQVIVPIALRRIPMVAVQTPGLPPLIIEGIVLAAGLSGFFVTVQRRAQER